MQTINNFNQSSTGINIEFCGSYDTWNMTRIFEDNFKFIQESHYNKNTILVYTDYGNLTEEIDFKNGKLKGLKKFMEAYYIEHISSCGFEGSKQELMEEIIYNEGMEKFSDLEYFQEKLKEFDLEYKLNFDLEVFECRGYSQGDYAEVYVNMTELRKVSGNKNIQVKKSYLENLLYKAPINTKITINDEEFDISDIFDKNLDEYSDWDDLREAFAKYVADKTNIDIAKILEVMPEELEYQD